MTVTVRPDDAVTVQAKLAVPNAPDESVAVTVTEYEPATDGAPEINPVAPLIDKPVGSPVARYVNVDAAESLARTCRLTALFTEVDCAAGVVTVMTCAVAAVIVQANDTAPVAPVESLTLIAGAYEPTTVGVPEIKPVAELIDRPFGKPTAT